MAGGRPLILHAEVVAAADVVDEVLEEDFEVVVGAAGVVEGAAGVVEGALGVVDGAAGVVDGSLGVVDGAAGVVDGAAGVVEGATRFLTPEVQAAVTVTAVLTAVPV